MIGSQDIWDKLRCWQWDFQSRLQALHRDVESLAEVLERLHQTWPGH